MSPSESPLMGAPLQTGVAGPAGATGPVGTPSAWTTWLQREELTLEELHHAVAAWSQMTPAGKRLLLGHPALSESARRQLLLSWLEDLRLMYPPGPYETDPRSSRDSPWENRTWAVHLWTPERAQGLLHLRGAAAERWCRTFWETVDPRWCGPLLSHPACPEDILLAAIDGGLADGPRASRSPARGRVSPAPALHPGDGDATGAPRPAGHAGAFAPKDGTDRPALVTEAAAPQALSDTWPRWSWGSLSAQDRLDVARLALRNAGLSAVVLEATADTLRRRRGRTGHGRTLWLNLLLHPQWVPAARSWHLRHSWCAPAAPGEAPLWPLQHLLSSEEEMDAVRRLPLRDQVRLLLGQGATSLDIRRLIGGTGREHSLAAPVIRLVVRAWIRKGLQVLGVPRPLGGTAPRVGTRPLGEAETEHDVVSIIQLAFARPELCHALRPVWEQLWSQGWSLPAIITPAVLTKLRQASSREKKRWIRPLVISARQDIREQGLQLWALVAGDA